MGRAGVAAHPVQVGQTAAEGGERLGRLAAVLVGGGEPEPYLEGEALVAGRLRVPERLLGQQRAGLAVGHLPGTAHEFLDTLAHEVCTAHSMRPRNDRLSTAVSAARRG